MSATESSNDKGLEIFKQNVSDFLEKSFLSIVALLVLAGMNYLAFLPKNVQNTLPLLLIVFLGTYTWIMRAKILEVRPEELRV